MAREFDIVSPVDIQGQLMILYTESEVTSGEFIHTVTFDPKIPYALINNEVRDFLTWDDSREDFDIRKENHWKGEK